MVHSTRNGETFRSAVDDRRMQIVLLLATVFLLALRVWHIRADFTVNSFYNQDAARYSDEGFYTSAALNYFISGHVYIPGGWNPGIFMPVWPFMVGLLFHFTGISIAAARLLAVACTWISAVLAYFVTRQYRSRIFASLTVFLIAANALGFFFGRMALLEPAFVMYLLLAIWLAGRIRIGGYFLAVATGVVFVLATLTKTSGVFMLPAVLYPTWANNRKDRAGALSLVMTMLATALLLLGCAKLIWMYGYSADAGAIFALRPLWQLENSPLRLVRFFFRGTWIDPLLFPMALACVIAAIVRLRFLWRDTLFVIAFLWEACYAAFIVFHFDGPPRYFVAIVVPTIWLALIYVEWLWRRHRRVGLALAACIVVSVGWNLTAIGNYLAHPRYRLLDASLSIRRIISQQQKINPGANALLIGRRVDEVSLLSGGLPAMDSDGPMPLAKKLDVYHPGWFMQWSNDPPLRASIVAEHRRMVQRAFFPGLDRYHHAGILLYQLFPKSAP